MENLLQVESHESEFYNLRTVRSGGGPNSTTVCSKIAVGTPNVPEATTYKIKVVTPIDS